VALLLVVVGIVANTLPAYRATRVEPVRTLREE
jgi:ABC-type lipoprotein release transport system permease subunit